MPVPEELQTTNWKMPRHERRALIASVWIACLAFCCGLTIADPDLWGHTLYGMRAAEKGVLVERADPFSYTAPNGVWINHEWLTEFQFGWLWKTWGNTGLWMWRNLMVVAVFGVAVLVQAGLRAHAGVQPVVPAMFGVGLVALLANTYCFSLLWRHRADDINLRSTWLCSRNDLVANCAVLLAAGLVAWSQSIWPDLAVGVLIACLFLRTAASVVRESVGELGRANEIAGVH